MSFTEVSDDEHHELNKELEAIETDLKNLLAKYPDWLVISILTKKDGSFGAVGNGCICCASEKLQFMIDDQNLEHIGSDDDTDGVVH